MSTDKPEELPSEEELGQMSRDELVKLGSKLDGVELVEYPDPWPVKGTRAEKRAERQGAFWFALAGLAGLALSAMAAHAAGGPNLDTAARFLLVHAPVLLAAAALAHTGAVNPSLGRIAGWLMVLGLALFCGDLVMRALRETPLFPRAAPIGGFLLMGGWGLLALAALARLWR